MLPAPRINDVLHRVTLRLVGNPQGVKFSGDWYNLDYALAELTHEKLLRTKTLVRGDDRCDFRLN